jgi:phytanoyl-CoA hydroxylase
MFFRDAPEDSRESLYKLNDTYLLLPEIRNLALSQNLAAILSNLLDRPPAICNSLNFERGSGQPCHFDTFYMPHPAGNGLIVTSICFEDVHIKAGPLIYYPGSHLIPPFVNKRGRTNIRTQAEHEAAMQYINAEIRNRQLQPESFVGYAGDVFIWHEQLYHGVQNVKDLNLTRKSLVTHY